MTPQQDDGGAPGPEPETGPQVPAGDLDESQISEPEKKVMNFGEFQALLLDEFKKRWDVDKDRYYTLGDILQKSIDDGIQIKPEYITAAVDHLCQDGLLLCESGADPEVIKYKLSIRGNQEYLQRKKISGVEGFLESRKGGSVFKHAISFLLELFIFITLIIPYAIVPIFKIEQFGLPGQFVMISTILLFYSYIMVKSTVIPLAESAEKKETRLPDEGVRSNFPFLILRVLILNNLDKVYQKDLKTKEKTYLSIQEVSTQLVMADKDAIHEGVLIAGFMSLCEGGYIESISRIATNDITDMRYRITEKGHEYFISNKGLLSPSPTDYIKKYLLKQKEEFQLPIKKTLKDDIIKMTPALFLFSIMFVLEIVAIYLIAWPYAISPLWAIVMGGGALAVGALVLEFAIIIGLFYIVVSTSVGPLRKILDTVRVDLVAATFEEMEKYENQALEKLTGPTTPEMKILHSISFSRRSLEAYYKISENQTKKSFRYSIAAMFMGFMIILLGVASSFGFVEYFFPGIQPTDINTIVIAGGAISEMISALFLWVYNRSTSQLTYFYNRQIHAHNMLLAFAIADSAKADGDKAMAVKQEIIDNILEVSKVRPPDEKGYSMNDFIEHMSKLKAAAAGQAKVKRAP